MRSPVRPRTLAPEADRDPLASEPGEASRETQETAGAVEHGSTVATSLVREIVRVGSLRGISDSELLTPLGPFAGELDDDDARLPTDLAADLWRSLAQKRPGHAHALTPSFNTRNALGALGYLARASATGRDALQAMVEFSRIPSSSLELTVDETANGDVRVGLENMPDLEALGHPLELGLTLIARTVVDAPEGIAGVTLKHAPLGARHTYRATLGNAVRFEAEHTALWLHAEALDRPRPDADRRLAKYVRTHLEQALQDLSSRAPVEPFSRRLHRSVREAADDGSFRVQAIARRLHISERHLQRVAQRYGLELGSLLMQERRRRAERLLRDPSLAVADVAEQVGYADARSFSRAFKRWTSLTPAQWRRRATR